MARARSLKPSFFTNEQLAECSPLARLLFAGLWCWADREGYLEDRPKRLRAEILPYDQADGAALVRELVDAGLVERLDLQGTRVLHVVNFTKYQDPHPRETPSRYAQGSPKADVGGALTGSSPSKPSKPSSPSSPSSPTGIASQPIPINVGSAGMAVVPDWLAGVKDELAQALNTDMSVGKDPAEVVEAFSRRRAYLTAEGYPDPDATLVGDCLGATSRAKPGAGKPSSLAFFVGWLNRATPKNFATGGTP